MTAETVLDMLAERQALSPLFVPISKRAEEPLEPPRVKVYRMWITPEGGVKFPLAVDAFSLHEARELATKAAPLLSQVGARPFTVSGREA
jgi:hypothetical protein